MATLEEIFVEDGRVQDKKLKGAMLKFIREKNKIKGKREHTMVDRLVDEFDIYMQEQFRPADWHNFLREYRITWMKFDRLFDSMLFGHEEFVEEMNKTYISYKNE